MGQSSSSFDNDDELLNLQGKDLLDLTPMELEIFFEQQDRPFTAEEILNVARSLKNNPRNTNNDNNHPPTSSSFSTNTTSTSASFESLSSKTKNGHGFYAQEEDSPEIDFARLIHGTSDELAQLRFQLVPSKVKEPIFWEATFLILRERLQEYNDNYYRWQLQTQRNDNEQEEQANGEPRMIQDGQKQERQQQPTTTSQYSTSFPDDVTITMTDNNNSKRPSSKDSTSLLAKKDLQIEALKRQVEELKLKVEETHKHHHHHHHHAHPEQSHNGKWIMDPDSRDFLNYPTEVKENMRREKQKRLKQVYQDMKFILDSDDIQDTHGHWECCGETKYSTACTKKSRNKR